MTGDKSLLSYTLAPPGRKLTVEGIPILSAIGHSEPLWTVPELLFEKEGLTPAVKRWLGHTISRHGYSAAHKLLG